ncbi:MAG: response regulator [Sandaracinaceae bacterium]|nr:response regulator [Sandaracinaceae bacterium]
MRGPKSVARVADFDDTQRGRLEQVIELASRIATRDFDARGALSPAHDEIDALVACLNIVAEDFALEHSRRAQAEDALRDTIEAYEDAPAMFCSVDASTGLVLQCNRTMERVLGRERAWLIGRPLESLYTAASADLVRASLAALTAGTWMAPADHELLTAEGRSIPTLLSGFVVRDEAGAPRRLRLIYRDVREERALESQLLSAQRMEGIGRLAGGIAHDFNNLLTAILTSAEMLEGEVSEQGSEDLELVLRAGRRAAELTSQLLAFSRRTVVAPRPVDPNEVVRGMEKLLRRTLGETIEIVTATDPSAWTVVIDPARFEQVLMNLAVNAKDAMPHGGRLTLTTQNVELDEARAATVQGARAGSYVELAVGDEGVGMGREVLDRLFEPFFTTKEVGKGTGLGLAMVWGTVRQAGGAISVTSEPGHGTTFRILLPRAGGPAQEVPPASDGAGRGSERVLVVEDDALVRALVVRTLRGAGYDVSVASDGQEALELLEAMDPAVDLVVSDVVMPRLGGRELAEQIRLRSLADRVLFVSGYAASLVVAPAGERGRSFLQKPFTSALLLAAVRSALDTPA